MKYLVLLLLASTALTLPTYAQDGAGGPLVDPATMPTITSEPVVPTAPVVDVLSPPPAMLDEVTPMSTPSVAVPPPPPPVMAAPEPVAEPVVATPPKPVVEQPVEAAPKKKAKKKKQPPPEPLTPTETTENVLNTLLEPADPTIPALGLADALREAYLNNPTLRASRAQVKASFERVPQALARFQPTVTASGAVTAGDIDNRPGADSDGTETTAALNLTQPLFRGGRSVAGTLAADALFDAQLATLASTERRVLLGAAQSYMDVMRTQASVRVNEKNRDVIARQLRATRDRFRVGDVTRTDVAQSEFRLAQAEADLTAAIGAWRSTRAQFEQVVGVMPERLVLPGQAFQFPATIDEAITMAEMYNPDVIAAQARHRAAEQNITLEGGELLPEVNLDAGYSTTRDAIATGQDRSDGATMGVRLSMPLYEGGAVRARVREAKYTANENYMRILEARRAAREEAVRAWENRLAAQAELVSRQSQVRAAEIARRGVRQEADLGQRTILDALDADLEVRDAQIALIAAKRNEIVADYALASSLGLLLPGNVGIDTAALNTDRYGFRLLGSPFSTAVDTEPETGR